MADTSKVLVGSVSKPVEMATVIDCVLCGLKEDVSSVSFLTRLERLEYHRRGGCVRDDLGVSDFYVTYDPNRSDKF